MLTVRLPKELEHELVRLASQQNTTKTQIIREALEEYVRTREAQPSSYDVGKSLFGRYASGSRNSSETYKSQLKDKLRAKHTR